MLSACSDRPSLNSERIQQRFGSYGVDVVYADGDFRLSSLYSIDNGKKTTRTLALVRLMHFDDPQVAALHDRITGGASIGATFRDAGWQVRKSTRAICAADLDLEKLPALSGMGVKWPQSLAVHEYVFSVSRDDRYTEYAQITEIHHPDYLDTGDLTTLYGSGHSLDCLQNATKLPARPNGAMAKGA